MNYKIINIKDEEYKLCLPMRMMVELEKKLATNPLNALIAMGENGNSMPSFEFIATVLMYALKKHHPKMDINKTYDLIDEYLEQGNDLTDLIALTLAVFEVSGYFRANNIEQPKK